MPSIRSFMVMPALPEPIKKLENLASNTFWTWNTEVALLFKRIDPKIWEQVNHNPVKLLGLVSQNRFDELAKNKGFICELNRASQKLNEYLNAPTWYQSVSPKCSPPVIAYFSAEFGLHECLPVYSGGLGILAGDHLKSASDLGIPLVGIGLMYQKGYFRQYLNIDGWQQEVYTENDFYNMPISIEKDKDAKPVEISVDFPDGPVFAQLWSIEVGRVKLLMLDTNVIKNSPEHRMITANLYGGDREMRIKQEILLGIGGLRALYAIGLEPTVCHMNEGHAAFMAIERIKKLRDSRNMTFDEALEATKAANVFTVHTPVKAGNDEFPIELMEKYFDSYYPALGISKEQFFALGKIDPNDQKELFKMPVLALRLSDYKNGVSKLHGDVSRKMWAPLWPQLPVSEVPITSITNGTHLKTWLSEELDALYQRYLGANWNDGPPESSIWENIDQIPDEELWRTHQRSKETLVAFARKRLKQQMIRRGTYHTELNWAEEVLDPEALTVGFARRFATYKRGYLLFKDPARITKILNNPEKPVQLVFAGKAHPHDTEGKEIIRQIIHFAAKNNFRRRIIFLEDYDINVAKFLVQGVDVWLNTPRPPMEASGTSGMKAAFNGALNFSTFDGWWCEGYSSNNGWIIGSGETYDDNAYQDTVESQAMYNILENEIIPLFYTRAADNLPRAWINRMKNTIKTITPAFNTHRMVAEYNAAFYEPAAKRWRYLTAEAMARAKALSMWKNNIKNAWNDFKILDVSVQLENPVENEQQNPQKKPITVGSKLSVKALVKLPNAKPNDVSVQLYNGPVDSWGNITNGSATNMRLAQQQTQPEPDTYCFDGQIYCKNSGRQGLAVRILPNHQDIPNPEELGLILWESKN